MKQVIFMGAMLTAICLLAAEEHPLKQFQDDFRDETDCSVKGQSSDTNEPAKELLAKYGNPHWKHIWFPTSENSDGESPYSNLYKEGGPLSKEEPIIFGKPNLMWDLIRQLREDLAR